MRTQDTLSGLVALVFLSAGSSVFAQAKIPPKYHAAPEEVMQLPKYCYSQYLDGSLSGFEFSIPQESCGPAMNHFCSGLVAMMRAQKLSLRKAERIGYSQDAIRNINYTLHDMKPGCFITNDVLSAKRRADMLAQIIK